MTPRKTFSAAVLLAAAFAPSRSAHDIPNDVTIQAFLKPEGQRLHLLVRVPLTAMRDINFPGARPGYLDIRRDRRPCCPTPRRCGSPISSRSTKATATAEAAR